MAKIKFQPLPNAVPEGTKAGDTFSLVCDFKLEDNGDVCLTKMGDVDAKYESDDRTGNKSYIRPNMDDEVKAMQSSMLSDTSGSSATMGNY